MPDQKNIVIPGTRLLHGAQTWNPILIPIIRTKTRIPGSIAKEPVMAPE
ncbi:MAG: hypothetical protein ACREPU_05435 [Rhodanobacteraceae bacterium]